MVSNEENKAVESGSKCTLESQLANGKNNYFRGEREIGV